MGASTGQVELPTADASVVRALVCLLSSNFAALDQLKLPLPVIIAVLAQAAEWECSSLVKALLCRAGQIIDVADGETSVQFLKLVSTHAAATGKLEWSSVLDRVVTRVAETREGDLTSLEHLPFETLTRVLSNDALDTADKEGCVLVFVTGWAKKHGMDHLPALLELVRFPHLRLTSLDAHESAAMSFAAEHADQVLRRLLGEAVRLQVNPQGGKRKRQEDTDVPSEECLRAQKRRRSSEIPELSNEQLAEVLCGYLCTGQNCSE